MNKSYNPFKSGKAKEKYLSFYDEHAKLWPVPSTNKWELTFRQGVNFATENLGDTKLNTGFGAEATNLKMITVFQDEYLGSSPLDMHSNF